jgi:adenylate kinase family enzyme
MNPYTFIFIGRSGCGKGTQAKLLMDYIAKSDDPRAKLPTYYLETGANFRQFVEGDSYSSQLSRQVMEAAELQPIFLAVWIWSHLFIENLKGDENLVLDGVPRHATEAEVLDSALKFYQRDKPCVIHINVSNDWSRERMRERGRLDDKNQADVDKRLAWFDSKVMGAIRYYDAHPDYRLIEINGEQTVDEVHRDIVANL